MTPRSGVLPFDDGPEGDLEALLQELDAALDASFLGDVRAALERAASPAAESPAAA